MVKFSKLITPFGMVENKYISIKNGMIDGIIDENNTGYKELDASQLTVLPGFVDIHTHGYYGIDSMDSTESDIHKWAKKLLQNGVTSFIPTGVSSSIENIEKFLQKIRAAMGSNNGEARILGARLEGPYISMEKKGAHNPEYIREINIDEISYLASQYSDVLKIIDIAPELKRFSEAVNIFQRNGITVSAGHSNASFMDANMAFGSGVKLMTHFYNAMTPLNHRNPGMVGAGLLSENVILELIADMHHVSPAAIGIMVKMKGLHNIALITDSLSIGGTDTKIGELGGLKININNGVAMIDGSDTIAGSILTLDKALKNIVSLGLPIEKIIQSLGYVQSRVLGDTGLGSISQGKRGDLCIIDDDLNVKYTVLNGEILYKN
ncbi:MAG: N-acetylglucosamine-6-phosphate deacetylase [Ferroplasma sp.]